LVWLGLLQPQGPGWGIPLMMIKKTRSLPTWLILAAALFVSLPMRQICAQNTPDTKTQSSQTASQPAAPTQASDRSQAYFHDALASIYENNAVTQGQQEYANRAIEEYKLALNADPDSAQLANALADLYFRIPGHIHDAEVTARNLLKTSPDDVTAHKLLGRIYLRRLGEGQNAGASPSSENEILNQAIGEFEKIVALTPRSVEDRMVLGQLYTVKHDQKKAEEQFNAARAIEPDSEDVILNMARLYADSGDLTRAAKVIADVAVDDRTPKMEFTLGAIYDQMKQPKNAIEAYKRAADLQPGDPRTLDALAQALMNNDQLDEALKQYRDLAAADSDNAEPLVKIADILSRQGKYEEALTTVRKARSLDPTSLEAGFNEGRLLDIIGHFDEAAQTYAHMVDLTSHANGAYTDEEKNNRSIFLDRLGSVYMEQNKTDLAVATYQKMIEMGGDSEMRGYQSQVDAYRTAQQFDKALAVARKAAAANPKKRELKLMLAGELADQGKADEAFAMTKEMLTNTQDDRMVWVATAQMNVRLRRWKDAEEALAKAEPYSTRKEDKLYLLFLRGELAERQKRFEPAEQFFRQALELDPSNAMTLNYLGYMLADKGMRLPEALKMIRKAVDQEPWNGAYLDSLGWVYFKMGEYELAEENLRQAVARNQTDPTVHEHMGDLYEKTGRIRQAAEQWQLSLSEFAKSAPADLDPGDVAKVQKKLDAVRVKLANKDNVIGQPKPY
jgi:tetratricopeptide (TPR) repeat protein